MRRADGLSILAVLRKLLLRLRLHARKGLQGVRAPGLRRTVRRRIRGYSNGAILSRSATPYRAGRPECGKAASERESDATARIRTFEGDGGNLASCARFTGRAQCPAPAARMWYDSNERCPAEPGSTCLGQSRDMLSGHPGLFFATRPFVTPFWPNSRSR